MLCRSMTAGCRWRCSGASSGVLPPAVQARLGGRPGTSSGSVASVEGEAGQAVPVRCDPRRVMSPRSGFGGFRFPPAVIMVAVRWYLRYGLSYRDVEELLAERGIAVDRDCVPVGAAVHPSAGRRGPLLPACTR